MKKRRRWILLTVLILMIPYAGTMIYQKLEPSVDWKQSAEGFTIHMHRYGVDQVLTFEAYAVGVMAAVLDPDASDEALKAMAVTVRTYVSHMNHGQKMVEASLLGLAWASPSQRREMGIDEKRFRAAVTQTSKCVITYEGVCILPLFFYCSNGHTRNFENVWGTEMPYLRSVDSSMDKQSERYKRTVFVHEAMFDDGMTLQVVQKDEAGYISEIKCGSKVMSGEEFRCRYGLPSACFEYEVVNGGVLFTCYGEGHGVGLSICGMQAMAESGKTWQEILKWYFQGTEV